MERNRGGRPRHPDVLTPAEWRVLDALREGGTNAEIAARLALRPDTVKYHISNMLAKLELRDRRALAAWRPEERRGRLGAVLAVPPAAWAVVGRPLVLVGLGTAAVGGAAVAVVAAVGVLVVAFVLATGDDAPPFATPLVAPTAQGTLGPVGSCDAGIAVTNPDANTELVADCESLLGLRDTIRGTGTLNWTAGKAMSEWMGVTVSGTPQRVTALNLADLGLDGQLSGLLGNLTGLTTLDLSGNALTGMLPSKLALLTSLTTVSISGTSFTSCAPTSLWKVATNDVAATGMDECGATRDAADWLVVFSDWARDPSAAPTLPPGTYYSDALRVHNSDLVFDVPAGASVVYMGVGLTNRSVPEPGEDDQSRSDLSAGFRDTNSWSGFGIDAMYSGYFGIVYDPNLDDAERAAFEATMEYMVESSWLRPR